MRISDWSSDVCSSDLVDDAIIVERVIILRMACREEGARAEGREDARVDQAEDTEEFIFARRTRDPDAEIFGRDHGAIVDGRTGGGRRRAVDVGGDRRSGV